MGSFGTHTLTGSVHNPLMLNFNSVLFCSDLLFSHVTCKSCENIALFFFSMQISLKTTMYVRLQTLQTMDLQTEPAYFILLGYQASIEAMAFHKLVQCYDKLQDKYQFATVLLSTEIHGCVLFVRTSGHTL